MFLTRRNDMASPGHRNIWLQQDEADEEELKERADDNEDGESAKEEVNLGKLNFTIDYDFQKSEVGGS